MIKRHLPDGIAFSADRQYVYSGNSIDQDVQVFRIAGSKLVATGVTVTAPGQPAWLQGVAH